MGKLVVIEGTDGSGKETQMNILENNLKKKGIEFRRISFPNYGSSSSSLVKMYLSGKFGTDAKSISPYIASTFYAADRYATFKVELEEYYNDGGLIIADRYTTASMVHQACKVCDEGERTFFLDWLCDLEFNIYKIPKPDKVFFLDMPICFTEKLIANRKNKYDDNEKLDIHERDKKYLESCYITACDVAKRFKWKSISCAPNGVLRTKEDIGNEILDDVLSVIKKGTKTV